MFDFKLIITIGSLIELTKWAKERVIFYMIINVLLIALDMCVIKGMIV